MTLAKTSGESLETGKTAVTLQNRWFMKRQVRIRTALGVACAVALLLSACAASKPAGTAHSTAGTAHSTAPKTSLTVSVGGVGAYNAAVYLAQIEGDFKKFGLTVDLSNGAANVITLVLGGRADIGVNGVNTAFVPVPQGQETSVVRVIDTAGSNAGFVAVKGITQPSQCTRVATASLGTSASTFATAYKQALGLNYQIVNSPNAQDQLGMLLSGQAQCMVGIYPSYAQGLLDGSLHYLINAAKPSTAPKSMRALFNAPGVAAFGLKANLATKSNALTAFQKGLNVAMKKIRTSDPEAIAKTLQQDDDWKSIPTATIVSQLKVEANFTNPNDGVFLKSQWPAALKLAKYTVPTVDPKNAEWAYSHRVDMSSLDAANGK